MTTTQFWKIVEDVHASSPVDMEVKCELLLTKLEALNDEELKSFILLFHETHERAYDHGLWAAAYVICGGCSDDKFSDFRANLISYGQEVLERALEDPDFLADVPIETSAAFEGYDFVVTECEQKRFAHPVPRPAGPAEPTGEDWGEDPEILARRLPRLSRKFSQPLVPSKRPWWKFW